MSNLAVSIGGVALATAVGVGTGLAFGALNAHEVNDAVEHAPTLEEKIRAAQSGGRNLSRLLPGILGFSAMLGGGLVLNGALGPGKMAIGAAIMGAGAGLTLGAGSTLFHPDYKVTSHTTQTLDPWK